jgi:uncharacterized protein
MRHRCPICKIATNSELHADFPFCSEKCRLLDLGAWASEKYTVSEPIFDETEVEELGAQSEARKRPNGTIQ